MRASDIMTLGAGQRLHTRTDGPCRWGSIWLPAPELVRYGNALTGAVFAVPSVARWLLLRPAMSKHLRHLHSAATGAVESRSRAFRDPFPQSYAFVITPSAAYVISEQWNASFSCR